MRFFIRPPSSPFWTVLVLLYISLYLSHASHIIDLEIRLGGVLFFSFFLLPYTWANAAEAHMLCYWPQFQ